MKIPARRKPPVEEPDVTDQRMGIIFDAADGLLDELNDLVKRVAEIGHRTKQVSSQYQRS